MQREPDNNKLNANAFCLAVPQTLHTNGLAPVFLVLEFNCSWRLVHCPFMVRPLQAAVRTFCSCSLTTSGLTPLAHGAIYT